MGSNFVDYRDVIKHIEREIDKPYYNNMDEDIIKGIYHGLSIGSIGNYFENVNKELEKYFDNEYYFNKGRLNTSYSGKDLSVSVYTKTSLGSVNTKAIISDLGDAYSLRTEPFIVGVDENLFGNIKLVDKGTDVLREVISELLITHVKCFVIMYNLDYLNEVYLPTGKEKSKYYIQFSVFEKGKFITDISKDYVVFQLKPSYLLNVENLEKDIKDMEYPTRLSITGYLNILEFLREAHRLSIIKNGGLETGSLHISEAQWANIRTLVGKFATLINRNKVQTANLLYEREGLIMTVYSNMYRIENRRRVDVKIVPVLKFDVVTLEMYEV